MDGRAIPPGYMTAGEAAKKMGVSVRTLQHYDREGLLPPSSLSEGGRRLYTDKDLVRLHQILSLKRLGFSLRDIKDRLPGLDTPAEAAQALAQQAQALRERMAELAEAVAQLEVLREEALRMRTVDFKKYADIIVNLQMGNEYYWLIKYFDDQTLDHIRGRFDQDSGKAFLETFLALQEEAVRLGRAGTAPDSPQGRQFAAAYWEMLQTFTGGDGTMLPKLMELGKFQGADPRWRARQEEAAAFVGPALDAYLSGLGIDPFQEAVP